MSIESVVGDRITPITPWEAANLPVKPVDKMLQIGLRKEPESDNVSMTVEFPSSRENSVSGSQSSGQYSPII